MPCLLGSTDPMGQSGVSRRSTTSTMLPLAAYRPPAYRTAVALSANCQADPLRDVGHAYAQKLAAAGNELTYVHNPDLTHGFPQFTRSSAACHRATLELADLIQAKIG